MNSQIKLRIEEILISHNFSKLLPISYQMRKPGCSIWTARLYANHGDADCQVQAFDLLNDPGSIVDYEEEMLSLVNKLHPQYLVSFLQTDSLGILITCAATGIAIFDQYMKVPMENGHVTYHPQLNRLLGGDYFHQVEQFNNKWFKATMASVEKAKMLKELLDKAIYFYEQEPEWTGKLKDPLPRILAILQIPAIEIPGAPAEFKELGLIQSLISHPGCIQDPAMLQYINWNEFSSQVFGFLRTQHKHGICYSSFAGCCLRPEFLCPDGGLTDAYFINCPESISVFRKAAKRDLGNFLLVLCHGGIAPALLGEAILSGVKKYVGLEIPGDLVLLIDLITQGSLDQENLRINALATEILNFSNNFPSQV